MPRCYSLGYRHERVAFTTHYQVFVGPGTALEWYKLPDDPSNVLLVVEATNAVPWTKPDDLIYDPDKPLPALGGLFRKPTYLACYEIGRRDGFNACFGDGTVRFLYYDDTDERTIRGFISRSGGEGTGEGKIP